MKSNLFKKIGAMVTTVAMIASLGTVAFAAASITIDDAATSISDPDANNVRTVTVTYNATEVTGEVAVLGYVGTKAEDDVITQVPYDETKHTIVGIEQEAVDTTNKTITFKVKQDNSEDQSDVTGKDYLYITLGAQGVDVADTAVIELATEPPVETNWTATQVAFVSDADLSVDVDYGADKAAAALATLKAAAITLGNGTKSVNTTLEALGAVVNYGTPAVSGDVYTYTITFTAGDSGINDTDGKDVLLGTGLTLTKAVTVNEDDAPVVNDNYVTIGVAEAEYDETNNIFDVTVPYTTTNAKENGEVAMMAYIGRTSAFTDDTEHEYANEDTMRIIGIAQKTNGTNGGTFEYKVTGDIGENTYMVVKVGAQGVNVAPDMVAIPLTKTTTPDEPTVVTATHATIDQIEAEDVAAVKLALEGKTATVKNDSAVVGTVALTAEMINTVATYDGAAVGGLEANYKLTIPAGTEVMSGATAVGVIGEDGLTAYLYAEPPVVEWTATVATASGNTTATWTTDEAADADAVAAKVLEAVQTMTVTLTDDDAETNYTASASLAALTAENVTTGDSYPAEGGTMTYIVTIPTNIELTSSAPNAPQAVNASFTYTVTITVAQAAEWEVTDVDFGSINVTVADAANIATAVADWFKGKTFNATGADNAAGTITLKADAAVTVEAVAPGAAGANTVKVTIPAAAIASTTNNAKVTDSYVEEGVAVTVTVQAAPQYMLGDINNNGRLDNVDLTRLTNHRLGTQLLDLANPQVMYSADINGNGRIDNVDLTKLTNHRLGTQLIVQP